MRCRAAVRSALGPEQSNLAAPTATEARNSVASACRKVPTSTAGPFVAELRRQPNELPTVSDERIGQVIPASGMGPDGVCAVVLAGR